MIHSNPRYLFFPVHNSHTKVISKRALPSIKNFVSGEIFLSIILSVSLLGTVILLVTVGNFISQRAYGDGLTAENLPPATVGDRQASLFVKISPPILTTESKGNAFLQFRLYD